MSAVQVLRRVWPRSPAAHARNSDAPSHRAYAQRPVTLDPQSVGMSPGRCPWPRYWSRHGGNASEA